MEFRRLIPLEKQRSNGLGSASHLTMGYDHLGQFPPNEMDGMSQ